MIASRAPGLSADSSTKRQPSCSSPRARSCRWRSAKGRLGHHGDHCSFDAFLDKYKLNDPALQALALIVRGADTDARQLTPESAGLYAVATGFQAIAKDDHDNMTKQFPAYDALYAYCQARVRPS